MEYENFFDAYIVRMCVRWAVPFFFMTSGYFLKCDIKSFLKYLLHILIQYLFWTVFYALVLNLDIWSLWDFCSALRSGIITPFWYYSSLLLCVTVVWILFKVIKNSRIILAVCFIMFLIAIIGHTLTNVPAFDCINNSILMEFHERITGALTTRDGIFWGSFYIAIGKFLSLYKDTDVLKIKNEKKYVVIMAVLFVITAIEECVVVYHNTGGCDVLLGTAPFVVMLFIYGLNRRMDVKVGIFLRTMSTAIFVMHFLFVIVFMNLGMISVKLFISVVLCTLVVAFILACLKKHVKVINYIV